MNDLILCNANIITMDPANPVAEIAAIKNGIITFVGSKHKLKDLRDTKTQVIDCAGKTLIPGFVDAHCHVHAYAEALVSLDLSPSGSKVRSIPDLQKKLHDYCQGIPAGSWVRGKGYNEFYWEEKRHPNRWDLDSAASMHPVKLTHRSGHAHVLNSLALNKVGIKDETGDPPEGYIDRDPATGLPTGILYGMSSYLSEKIPSLDELELGRGVSLANSRLLSLGVTSVQDASFMNGLAHWKRFEMWKDRQLFHPRVTMMVGLQAFLDIGTEIYVSHLAPDELKIGPIKLFADEVTGNLYPKQEELNRAIAQIHAAGRQAAIHAIESSVIEAAGTAIAHAIRGTNQYRDHRHRIEHCSTCNPSLLKRLANLGVVVVTQPSFIYYGGDRYLESLPDKQLLDLYAVKAMLDSGLGVAFGSDFPIAAPNPMAGIYAAVTRKTETGAILPQKGIGVAEALRMHTLDAAKASFEEQVKGSIAKGKLADLLMLSANPLTIEAEQLKDLRVEMTILGGRVAYSA